MSGVAAARMAAYRTLCIARERDAYVRELVNSGAAQEVLGHLKAEDRAFARKLALGVCATAGTLDEALDRYIAKPAKVAPGVRDALRISAYELLFLDKPAHVVVSQGVELVRSRAKSAAGLANAVLRRVAENAQAFMAESVPHRCGIPCRGDDEQGVIPGGDDLPRLRCRGAGKRLPDGLQPLLQGGGGRFRLAGGGLHQQQLAGVPLLNGDAPAARKQCAFPDLQQCRQVGRTL